METIRVGVVGASPGRGWASAAHLPALAALDDFTVTAVATTRPESAAAAAAEYGARHAFTSAIELAEHPDVDLVVVSVRAPHHAAAIRPALAAGKHVFSEWPLGVDLAEATGLATAAEAAGVVNAVALQVFHSPSARYVRDLVADGRVGRVDAVGFIAAGDPLGGDRLPPTLAWSADAAAGNTVLTIMAAHALAALELVTAPLADLTAMVTHRDAEVAVGTGRIRSSAPSQVAAIGHLTDGALATLAIHGGSGPGPDGFVLRIAGTGGALTITPQHPGDYPGWATWRILASTVDGESTELAVPDRYRTVPAELTGPAANIAGAYAEIAAAIRDGRPAEPGFGTAVRYHELVAAIDESARTGSRQQVTR